MLCAFWIGSNIGHALRKELESSSPRGSKEEMEREMEEGQGVERHHEVRSQDIKLNPDLWANLPLDVIDMIIKKVLIGLPFSRVLSFCSACQRWKHFLASMEHLLYFHKLDEFMIFNPRTGLWKSMPLLLSPADELRLQHMELVSCDGGRLYFASALREEFIVCNPLTGRCSPTLRGPNALRLLCNAKGKTSMSVPSEWRLGWYVTMRDAWNASPFGAQGIIVNNIVTSDQGHFQLLVDKQYQCGTPTVTLKLKDSRSGVWVTVPDVHSDFHFTVFPTFLWESGTRKSVMLGFYRYPGRPFNVLLYDIEERKCHWVWNVHSLQNQVGMSRQTLFATVRGGGELHGEVEFLEIQDGGFTFARAPLPPPMEVLRKNVSHCNMPDGTTTLEIAEMLNFVYVEQGHNAFHICLFRQSPRGQVNISVRRQNLVNGSQRISNWIEFGPSAWESTELPSSRNFHIFSPSLLDMPLELNIP